MKRFKLLRLSLRAYVAGLCVVAAVFVLIPFIGEKIFWGTEESVYTTQYIFLAYVGFFLIVVGILIPILRWLLSFLKQKHTHPLDALLTCIISTASSVPLLLLTLSTISALRSQRLARYKYRIYNFAASATLFLIGTPQRYHGHIRKKNGKPTILIANHTSSIPDYIGVSVVAGSDPWTILAGINLATNTSTFGDWVISKTVGPIVQEHAIAINRNEADSRSDSARRIYAALNEGKNIVVFPEGTRLQVSDIIEHGTLLQPFKDGIFRIAWKTDTPIQTVVFDWPAIWRGKNDPRFGFRPTTVHVYLGEIVYPRQFNSAEELRDYCWQIMYDKLSTSKRVQRFLKTV
jgi:1-acyl-sn-glycerol-3-phosphate acyltransferase